MDTILPSTTNGHLPIRKPFGLVDQPTLKRNPLGVANQLNILPKSDDDETHPAKNNLNPAMFSVFCDEDQENMPTAASNMPERTRKFALAEVALTDQSQIPMDIDSIPTSAKSPTPPLSVAVCKGDDLYVDDWAAYVKTRCHLFQPKQNYMARQTELNKAMREILVDWIVDVGNELGLEFERTIFLAVNYIDRFLSKMSVTRSKIQLVGTGSLLVAGKFEEIYPPEVNGLAEYTAGSYTVEQVLRMELLILTTLDFQVNPVTVYDCTCTLLRSLKLRGQPVDQVLTETIKYLSEVTLVNYEFLAHPVLLRAAACLWLAYYWDMKPLDGPTLAELAGADLRSVEPCVRLLLGTLANIRQIGEAAVFHKYNEPSRGQISSKVEFALSHRPVSFSS